MFKDYKDFLFNNKIMLKSQQRFKSDYHNVSLNKLMKLRKVVMMIRDCKHSIKLQHICMEQTHSKYAKVRW